MSDNEYKQQDQQMQSVFGELARGEWPLHSRVRYRDASGQYHVGEVAWILLPHRDVAGRPRPTTYVLIPDTSQWPEEYPHSSIVGLESETPDPIATDPEPLMRKCSFCTGWHYDPDQCPLNPNKQLGEG